MTQIALTIGSFFLAFGPLLGLFSIVVYPKAQLVILVTTAAFFFLLSATATGVLWRLLHLIFHDNPLIALLPSVVSQFVFRCGYVSVYHQVEAGIERALDESMPVEENENTTELRNAVAKFRLALNDASAAMASAVGFGGMHAVLLYGSLLASEITNDVGVLYQDYCPMIPSIAASAVLANLHSILQVFWMLCTFFGMRRRLVFARGEEIETTATTGSWMSNTRAGGNTALLFTFGSQSVAACLSLVNGTRHGCLISIPATVGLVLTSAFMFWAGCGRHFLLDQSSNRRRDE